MKSAQSSIGVLWRRAPIWRLALLLAVLLMFVFVLFPPTVGMQSNPEVPQPLAEANYVPVHSSVAETQTPDTPPGPRSADSNTQVPQAPSSHPHATTNPATPTASPAPKSAELSLTSPDTSIRGTGEQSPIVKTYSGTLPVNGFKVPLPPGTWSELANSRVAIPNSHGMGYFLGMIKGNQLTGAVIVYALRSNLKPGAGYELFKGCNSPNAIFVANEGATSFGHQSCWVISSYFTPTWQHWADRKFQMNNLFRAAIGDMAAKNITYPQDLIAVQFFRAESNSLLDASFLFSPESQGVTSSRAATVRDTDWFGDNLQRYPEKLAYVMKLRNWGTSFWQEIKNAYANGG